MKVQNMTSSRGNKIANQFVITSDDGSQVFQSYDSVICRRYPAGTTEIDATYWDYSVTTSKYRNQFLGETKAETQKKIDSGEYILTNLN